jgi:heat shock protein HtpX
MTENPAVGYGRVLGPVDRESFLDAQVRHRRASRRFTALSAVAIGLTGIPLSAVISPLLYGLAVVLSDLVNLVVDVPDPLAFVASDTTGDVPPGLWPVIAAALVIPGSVAMLLTWLGVRRAFRRAGSGTALLALGAREPRGDLEERQIRNLVDEMAAAAGIVPPRVMVLDSEVPNAVAVGSGIEDATVVVTTGLLERLGRAETQAVVGHAVASVGNGDLRIGTTLMSVFQTLGLVETVLRAPSERAPRRTLRRVFRYAFRRPGADDTAATAAMLMRAGSEVEVEQEPTPNAFKSMLLLPFLMAGLAFTTTRMLFGFVIVNPFLRRAWRARKHLADATAVQLTRDPGALARALDDIAERDPVVPGTEWASFLFVAGREVLTAKDADTETFGPPLAPRLERLRKMGADLEAAAPKYTRRQRVAFAAFATVTAPCWLPLLPLFLACGIVLTLVSLAIDMLFLAPMVALLHALLRGLAS